jgi:hypothetical protein
MGPWHVLTTVCKKIPPDAGGMPAALKNPYLKTL